MLLLRKTRHRHMAATFALLLWVMVLFINVAQACIPVPVSHQPVSNGVTLDAVAHVDCMGENSEHHQEACKLSCDMQMQEVAKEKSFDSSSGNQPAPLSQTLFLPWAVTDALLTRGSFNRPRLFQSNIALRFTRLTL